MKDASVAARMCGWSAGSSDLDEPDCCANPYIDPRRQEGARNRGGKLRRILSLPDRPGARGAVSRSQRIDVRCPQVREAPGRSAKYGGGLEGNTTSRSERNSDMDEAISDERGLDVLMTLIDLSEDEDRARELTPKNLTAALHGTWFDGNSARCVAQAFAGIVREAVEDNARICSEVGADAADSVRLQGLNALAGRLLDEAKAAPDDCLSLVAEIPGDTLAAKRVSIGRGFLTGISRATRDALRERDMLSEGREVGPATVEGGCPQDGREAELMESVYPDPRPDAQTCDSTAQIPVRPTCAAVDGCDAADAASAGAARVEADAVATKSEVVKTPGDSQGNPVFAGDEVYVNGAREKVRLVSAATSQVAYIDEDGSIIVASASALRKVVPDTDEIIESDAMMPAADYAALYGIESTDQAVRLDLVKRALRLRIR